MTMAQTTANSNGLKVQEIQQAFEGQSWKRVEDAPKHLDKYPSGIEPGTYISVVTAKARTADSSNENAEFCFVRTGEIAYPPSSLNLFRETKFLVADKDGTWHRCHSSGSRYGIDEVRAVLDPRGWKKGPGPSPDSSDHDILEGALFTQVRSISTSADDGGTRPYFYLAGDQDISPLDKVVCERKLFRRTSPDQAEEVKVTPSGSN